MTTEEAIVDTVRALPPDQQREVLHFAEFLQQKRAISPDEWTPRAYNPEDDPLAPFLGAFEATEPDVVRRHDAYLADAHADTHASEH